MSADTTPRRIRAHVRIPIDGSPADPLDRCPEPQVEGHLLEPNPGPRAYSPTYDEPRTSGRNPRQRFDEPPGKCVLVIARVCGGERIHDRQPFLRIRLNSLGHDQRIRCCTGGAGGHRRSQFARITRVVPELGAQRCSASHAASSHGHTPAIARRCSRPRRAYSAYVRSGVTCTRVSPPNR